MSKLNVKAKAETTVKTTKRVVSNGEQFVQAVSLLVVAVFSFTQLDQVTNKVWEYVVLTSLVVVGLRAAVEVINFLDKK